MYTIRDLCRISKLSRSAILYYDSMGLLKPACRSAANYRLYSDESIETLKKICLYRDAGVELKDIGILISGTEDDNLRIAILDSTLKWINIHIRELQEKQRAIIEMHKKSRGGDDSTAIEQFFDELLEKIPSFASCIDEAALGFGNDLEVE